MEPDRPPGRSGVQRREALILAVVGLVMLAALVVAAVAVGLAASGFVNNLDPRSEQARDGEPGDTEDPRARSPRAEPSVSEEAGSPETARSDPPEENEGAYRVGDIVGEGVPPSRTDMDDRETYLRVTGAEGMIFVCNMGDSESPKEGINFETEVPGEYELEVEDGDLASARLADTASFFSGIAPRLRAEILHQGQVVGSAQTRAQGGTLYVGWSPDAPPVPESRPDTVTVRVTGDKGAAFDGSLGRASNTNFAPGTGLEDVPERYETWSVKGTVPAEYEVPVDLDSEVALANFAKDTAASSYGEFEVELVHDGRVVERAGIGQPDEPLATSWPELGAG